MLSVGTKLGRYEILSQIGVGGIGKTLALARGRHTSDVVLMRDNR